ncbi:MAG TPA: preprotein translocase subunit YajC [Blastocatellia bacterium]|nr:preprotein translocase subunit YajC [Blastocatellia bacterium]
MNIAPGFILFFLQGGGAAGGGSLFTGLIAPMILVFGIFYFLIIRPQQKKQKQQQTEREKMLDSLKPNDKIITTGGIYGTIIGVRESTVMLRIAQGVSVELSRTAVAGMQSSDVKDVKEIETAKV